MSHFDDRRARIKLHTLAHFCSDLVLSSKIFIQRFSLVMSVCRRLAPGELEERGTSVTGYHLTLLPLVVNLCVVKPVT